MSASLQKTGDADAAAVAPGDALKIGFVATPWRAAGWAGFGIVAGALAIWQLGSVFRWGGIILVGIGIVAAYFAARALLYPPGEIVIDRDIVMLPRGRSTPTPLRYARNDVGAAYFLRRSVPWTRTAPVLVIEAGGRAHLYPRDWFENEAEQRQIIDALLADA